MKPKIKKSGKISNESFLKKMRSIYEKKINDLKQKKNIENKKLTETYQKNSNKKSFAKIVNESYKEMQGKKKREKYINDIKTGRIPPPPPKVIHQFNEIEVDSQGKIFGLTKKELLTKWKIELKTQKFNYLINKLRKRFINSNIRKNVILNYETPKGSKPGFLYINEFLINCNKIIGKSYLIRNGEKIDIPKGNFNENGIPFIIQKGDHIITGKNSFLSIEESPYEDCPESTNIILYPDSELKIISVKTMSKKINSELKNKFWVIEKIKLIKGLFFIKTKTLKKLDERLIISGYNEIKFKSKLSNLAKTNELNGFIELSNDNLTLFDVTNLITYKGIEIKNNIGLQKVTIIKNVVYKTALNKNLDSRINAIRKILKKLYLYIKKKELKKKLKYFIDEKKIINVQKNSYFPKLIEQKKELEKNLKEAKDNEEPDLIKGYENALKNFETLYPNIDTQPKSRNAIIKLEKEFEQSLKKAINSGNIEQVKYYLKFLQKLENPYSKIKIQTIETMSKLALNTDKQIVVSINDLKMPLQDYNQLNECDKLQKIN
jgi:uncharacterized membrane protein